MSISGDATPPSRADASGGMEMIVAPAVVDAFDSPAFLPTLPVAGAYPSIAEAAAPDDGAE